LTTGFSACSPIAPLWIYTAFDSMPELFTNSHERDERFCSFGAAEKGTGVKPAARAAGIKAARRRRSPGRGERNSGQRNLSPLSRL
jgi:hypothetical protein